MPKKPKILNPETGRYVSSTGRIGAELLLKARGGRGSSAHSTKRYRGRKSQPESDSETDSSEGSADLATDFDDTDTDAGTDADTDADADADTDADTDKASNAASSNAASDSSDTSDGERTISISGRILPKDRRAHSSVTKDKMLGDLRAR